MAVAEKERRLKNAEGVKATDMFQIDPRKIRVQADFNSRDFSAPDTIEHIAFLAASIAAIGVQNPITVRYDSRDNTAVLVDGECRLRAVLVAIENGEEILTIPAVPEVRGTSEAERILGQALRNMGKRFSDLELGHNFAKLTKFGWSESQIAEKSGLPLRKVQDVLNLHESPEALKEEVRAGAVAQGVAAAVIRETGSAETASEMITAGVKKAKEAGRKRATKTDIIGTGADAPVSSGVVIPRTMVPNLHLDIIRQVAGNAIIYADSSTGMRYTVCDLLNDEPEPREGLFAKIMKLATNTD